jgi:glycosyltransferase involved in cell wall biosynthesis
MFKYPIGVQLFNRPQYARRVLESIRNQTLDFDERSLTIYIDGFEDSIYHRKNAANFTNEVESIALEFFPDSAIKRFDLNCGIADLHNRLQSAVFAKTDQWGAFFEEDVVLDPMYLNELEKLIEISEDFDSIVKVGCFQIIGSLADLPRGLNGFYPGTGTKAFAERKNFFTSKQSVVAKFIEIEKISGDDSDNSIRCANLAAEGYFLPFFQKDALIESFMHFQNKFHVVTKPNMATDIGFEGVHNYTTTPLDIAIKENSNVVLVSERKIQLAQSFDQIVSESKEHIIENFKSVLQGYHVSKSRRAMINKVLLKTFRNFG